MKRRFIINDLSKDTKLHPDKVRLSVGTAAILGLLNYKLDTPPTTAYTMTYSEDGCIANCSFCAQARDHTSNRDLLSRVLWPAFRFDDVIKRLRENSKDVLKRICLQTINYPGFKEDAIKIIEEYKKNTDLPISIDSSPMDKKYLELFKERGVERISIPLDAATPEIFDEVKGRDVNGPYRWEKHIDSLKDAVEVYSRGFVGTNLIIGLGETEKEAIAFIQKMWDIGVETILFAFTPIHGTKLSMKPQPRLNSYKRIQIARFLINKNIINFKDIIFDEEDNIMSFKDKKEVLESLNDGIAFQTNGCPGCNRPYYNERPSGPFYNYPRPLTEIEILQELEYTGIGWHE